MHPNQQLLQKLFDSLNRHSHDEMAECYHDEATFRDIAFDLKGKGQIQAMWRMICTPDKRGRETKIKADVVSLAADDSKGRAVIIDDYIFRLTGKRVRNEIVSAFRFADGKIIEHNDQCDASVWANQAYAGLWGVPGLLLGRIEYVRRMLAMGKIR